MLLTKVIIYFKYGENLLLWPLPILPPSSLAMKCPDVNGKYVATYWYRSHVTYPYQKDPDVLQSYASTDHLFYHLLLFHH